MAISRVINFDDYYIHIGKANGNKAENIELQIDAQEEFSIVQFPSLKDRKSDFLKSFSQEHGNPLLNMSFKRRMPWWKVIELFESSNNSDGRLEYLDIHQNISTTTICIFF